ncbi:hypothetical protein Tco_0290899 [Tanacetum coccineum]
MSTSTMDHFTYTTNHETNAFIRPLERDARKTYGDYVCFNVLEGCQVIISELEIVKTDMISKRSLQLHDVGDMTFKLNGSWIAQRVEKMLINGIDTWALERRARAVFLSRTNTPYMNDDMLRAYCIKHALVRMFLYSGIDVLDADSDNGFCDPSYEPRAPLNYVYAELETIKYGVCMDKADVMIRDLEITLAIGSVSHRKKLPFPHFGQDFLFAMRQH